MRSTHRAGAATCGRSLILIAAFLSICCGSLIQRCESEKTAYQEMEEYDFPIGLLPTNVESYTLDTSDGSFVVYLSSSCSFTIDSYKLSYKKKITGKISTDTLKDLDGVSVKMWIFYISISKVIREGTKLNFYVGSISKSFPVSNFDECQECGSGLGCSGNFSQLLQSA
uniref:Uncharacterized protein n=1 Tax=Picea sitchensis TaxID=3332 RepID=B8LNX5_PICSI|nr:unknown [Picea sitchensis]